MSNRRRDDDDGSGMGVITFIVCVLIGMCFSPSAWGSCALFSGLDER